MVPPLLRGRDERGVRRETNMSSCEGDGWGEGEREEK